MIALYRRKEEGGRGHLPQMPHAGSAIVMVDIFIGNPTRDVSGK